MVLSGFFEITQTVIGIAKIAIGVTFPMLVSYFFRLFLLRFKNVEKNKKDYVSYHIDM